MKTLCKLLCILALLVHTSGLCRADALIISGPDAPGDGLQYTASGGATPYSWCISKGSITQYGVVSVSGKCGTAKITVWDSCGNKGTKTVNMPSIGIYGPETTIAQNGCGNTGGSVGYKYNGNTRTTVTYGTSGIPADLTIHDLSELAIGGPLIGGTPVYPCGDVFLYPLNRYGANGLWFNTPYGVRQCYYADAGSWTGCEPKSPNAGPWWSNGHYFVPNQTLVKGCCGSGGYTGAWIAFGWANYYCNNYPSDSYLSGLVDANGNPITVPSSTNGFLTKVFKVTEAVATCNESETACTPPPCDLKIAVNKYTIKPYNGGIINISGDITDSSGKPINWSITLPNGKTPVTGTGSPASALWDGKDKDGKLMEAGSYSATITASSSDMCSKSENVTIAVTPSTDNNGCALQVQVGSSANVANGNLSHSQDLFSAKGGALPLSMTLYYNSLDPFNGSLGRGWSSSYESYLLLNSDGSVLLKEGNWRRRLYTLSNGAYVGQPGDYGILVKNPDNTFTLSEKDGTKYNYGADGKILSITDRNNNTVTFAYSAGNLGAITDPAGHKASFTYDADNHLSGVTDPSGNNYILTYSNGTLATVTYPDGGVWRYTYDDKAFMLTKSDPLANTTKYDYDDGHRVISSTDTDGKTRSITYPAGTDTVKTTTFTEKDGGVWSYTYDTQAGTLTSKTDPQSGVTSYTYDANGNRLSTTGPDGTTTSNTYDGQGNMTSSTDSLNQTTIYTYNAFGQVTGIKDPQGNTTGYAYDAAGNMTAMTDSTGATTQYQYDAKGNVTKVTNDAGQATTFIYDTSGNLASVTDPSGTKTSFTYDAAGNMITQTDASGATTRFEYNAKNQLVKMTDSLGNVTIYAYDLAGNRVSATDANGNSTLYEYNAKGQVVKTTDAQGNATIYTYGATGCPSCGGGVDKLTALADANGNSTTYQYDNLGRLINETDPLGNITSYSYDAKGNLTAKTDANGNIVRYTYDSLGRLLKKSYPDNTEETFTYDAKGNILTAANKNISYTMTYDAAGRMLTSTDSSGKSVSYEYDALGNKTKMTSPEGKAITYRYDAANRLTTITNGGIFNFSYDQPGRRTKLLYPNGATVDCHVR